MVSITIKKVLGAKNIEDVKDIIKDHGVQNKDVKQTEWPSDELLERKIKISKNPENINISNKRFILTQAYSQRKKHKNGWFENGELLPKEDRINVFRCNILFFEYKKDVYAAFFTNNFSKIKRLIDDLMIAEYWGEFINAVDFEVEDDFLYWLLYRMVKKKGTISDNADIAEISAYKGLSMQNTHEMSGKGERIYELLGTMAYIFGNETLDSLSVGINYQNEHCVFKISRNGQIAISDKEYEGSFCDNYNGEEKNVRLCLLLYTQIIPALQHEYTVQKGKKEWSVKHRKEFVHETGINIIKRISKVLNLPGEITIKDILGDNYIKRGKVTGKSDIA